MDSPFECQARCAQTDECDYFSYEWEETPMNSGNYYHECYLKMSYDNPTSSADAACEIPAGPPPIWYVEWGSQDPNWHGASGPKVCAQQGEAAPIFIAEVAEGSSYNKYMEIYNPSDVSVDLTEYAFPNENNAVDVPGVHQFWNTCVHRPVRL